MDKNTYANLPSMTDYVFLGLCHGKAHEFD